MPASAALAPDFILLKQTETVENALAALTRAGCAQAAVTDEEGRACGVFSYQSLLRNVLPVTMPMGGGMTGTVTMDLKVGAAPGVAQRLRKVMPLPVSDFMERRFAQLPPETSLWESLNFLLSHGDTVVVVDGASQRPLGFITMASALKELMRLQESAA